MNLSVFIVQNLVNFIKNPAQLVVACCKQIFETCTYRLILKCLIANTLAYQLLHLLFDAFTEKKPGGYKNFQIETMQM